MLKRSLQGRVKREDLPLEKVDFKLPMPPSVNVLYQRRRGGGVALTEAAKSFREKVKRIVADRSDTVTLLSLRTNSVLPISLFSIYS